MRLYLDAAPVIYLIEEAPGFGEAVAERLSAGGLEVIASDLTRLECRVKPMREGDTDRLRDFDTYFSDAVAEVTPLSPAVVDQATRIRAHYGFRAPDALHVASAVVAGADVLLANDHRLDRFPEVTIEVIAPRT